MNALVVVIEIVLILLAILLIVAVLMQQGQKQGLGAIAGGAETFFGKNKSKAAEGRLATITKIAAIVFIVLALVTTIVVNKNTPEDAIGDLTDPGNLETALTEAYTAGEEQVAQDKAAADETADEAGETADVADDAAADDAAANETADVADDAAADDAAADETAADDTAE